MVKGTGQAYRIVITGLVQGVGFRPFIYRLAHQESVQGTVMNTLAGVIIHIEGRTSNLEAMITRIQHENPPMSQIYSMTIDETDHLEFTDFRIVMSEGSGESKLTISPDISLCDECAAEMVDPSDRRYQYPFINCVNCGPRFSIITDLPYDRPYTSMKPFVMCPECQYEYDEPGDRRFHAQPVACPVCGPHVALIDLENRLLAEEYAAIEQAAQLLHQGKIIALKGLGGYHLACDARSEQAVRELRQRKERPDKPFAVMVKNIQEATKMCVINEAEEKLLLSAHSPIVLLKKNEQNDIAAAVSPRNRRLGIMLPYTPLHRLLYGLAPSALVMTSGNKSGAPICFEDETAFQYLSPLADFFLIHDRPIVNQSDDSVAQEENGTIYLQRCGRGTAPYEFHLSGPLSSALACGAEKKAAVALATGTRIVLGQYLSDLSSSESFTGYTRAVNSLLALYKVQAELIIYDLHPDYLSTQFAQDFPCKTKVAVQHHHAHMASCLLENRHPGPAIGFCFDGTGYGDDHTVWGGEVLIGNLKSYTRIARCAPLQMPGGDQAIREPWRMALSYLHSVFREAAPSLVESLFPDIPRAKVRAIFQLLKNDFGPITSSLGRLFDIASVLLLKLRRISYEGQAAVEMQYLAESASGSPDPFSLKIRQQGDLTEILPQTFLQPLLEGILNGTDPAQLAFSFHHTIAHWISVQSVQLRNKYDIQNIVLTGGVFQNSLLLTLARKMLAGDNFNVLTHQRIPCNDGGIAFGQLAVGLTQQGYSLVQE